MPALLICLPMLFYGETIEKLQKVERNFFQIEEMLNKNRTIQKNWGEQQRFVLFLHIFNLGIGAKNGYKIGIIFKIIVMLWLFHSTFRKFMFADSFSVYYSLHSIVLIVPIMPIMPRRSQIVDSNGCIYYLCRTMEFIAKWYKRK